MNKSSDRLKSIRKSRGFSQETFSGSLGVSLRSYQNYESGRHPIPSGLLCSLAEIGINIHWLLTGDGKMDGPLQEEVARLEALVNYWQANYQLLEANINRARAMIKDRYSKQIAADLCDGLLPTLEVSIKFPHPAGKTEAPVVVAEKKVKDR